MQKLFSISKKTRIGWIGTGVMGQPMFGHILSAGFKGYVYNRTREKVNALFHQGAIWVDSPAEMISECDVVFTIVGYPEDVHEVYFGERGLMRKIAEKKVLIDMTTTSPSLAAEIAERAEEKGASAIDAPVSGGDVGARNATLSIMAGGDRKVFDSIMPLLSLLGKKIIHQGGPGSGQHTKMCNQITIASTMIGVCESLLYAYRSGLDPETMLLSVSGGAAACWTLDNLAPRIIKRDLEPGFYIDHFIKDMGIALDEARRMRISLPGLSLAYKLYNLLKEKGKGKKGTQALILALEEMSGISR